MLSYQKNALLSLLAQFKVKLYEADPQKELKLPDCNDYINALFIITRNLTSIEKQIKKL
jgi:hypothetical protein